VSAVLREFLEDRVWWSNTDCSTRAQINGSDCSVMFGIIGEPQPCETPAVPYLVVQRGSPYFPELAELLPSIEPDVPPPLV
jgi:hypothetical protein